MDSPGHKGERYIKVRVHNPRNEKQTQAYVGDVVVYAGKGFKVYSSTAFQDNFIPVVKEEKDASLTTKFSPSGRLVDLSKWAPGEDVDDDEEVRSELSHYRGEAGKEVETPPSQESVLVEP
jgi:hypothetical protein